MYRFIYLSIDPGNMLGTTINAITPDNQWCVLHTHTTNVNALIYHKFPRELIELQGERLFREIVTTEIVQKFATDWGVNIVVSESPYMGRFPQAFATLTECMVAIRKACYNYNAYMNFDTIDPSTIKKSVGVKGNSGDKELMREAVRKITNNSVPVDIMDEHSIDSIAIGYAWYRTVWLGQSKG